MADPLRVAPVASPGELLHALLAVSHAPAPEFLLSVNIAGFLYVSDVDVTRNTVRCPCASMLLCVSISSLDVDVTRNTVRCPCASMLLCVSIPSLHHQLQSLLGAMTGMQRNACRYACRYPGDQTECA